MQFERPYWSAASIGAFLALLSVAFERPLLLVGSAGIGAWLLANQFTFVRALERTRSRLIVEQVVLRGSVYTDEAASVALSARLSDPTALDVRVESQPPIAATESIREERTATLHGTTAETDYTVEFPVAGRYEFDAPTVTATDRNGFFSERFARGFGASIDVEPRTPRDIHIGAGGEQIATTYGHHDAGRLGSGLDPIELRAYVPGDAAQRIDWKATARLGEPYVREYKAETDRRVVLLFDHRAATEMGSDGETKLDYLREAALMFVNTADRFNDPIGLYTVGDEGLTGQFRPGATSAQYRTIRRTIQRLEATTSENERSTVGYSPAAAHRAAEELRTDETAFGTTLRPFFEGSGRYLIRLREDPLVETTRTQLRRLHGTAWRVLFTDDTNRVEVREAVKLARRGEGHVGVFLTPSVLFEPTGLTDLEEAYNRYLAFEEFRRELARLDRVSAFEVGPGDRISALLAARRRRAV